MHLKQHELKHSNVLLPAKQVKSSRYGDGLSGQKKEG